jgi:hypothetical protein
MARQMPGGTWRLASRPLSSTGISLSSSPPAIVKKRGKSGRYKIRKGYAMFVRIAGKTLFIGLDESDKMSKVSV